MRNLTMRQIVGICIVAILVIGMAGSVIDKMRAKNREDTLANTEITPTTATIQTSSSDDELDTRANEIMMAIMRAQFNDPGSVEFDEITYHGHADNWWDVKWRVEATNKYGGKGTAYAYAKVHFSGGDMNDDKNWVIDKTYIDEQ